MVFFINSPLQVLITASYSVDVLLKFVMLCVVCCRPVVVKDIINFIALKRDQPTTKYPWLKIHFFIKRQR